MTFQSTKWFYLLPKIIITDSNRNDRSKKHTYIHTHNIENSIHGAMSSLRIYYLKQRNTEFDFIFIVKYVCI